MKKKPAKKPARSLTPMQERGILDIIRRAPDLMKLIGWWEKWGDTVTQAGRELFAILKPK